MHSSRHPEGKHLVERPNNWSKLLSLEVMMPNYQAPSVVTRQRSLFPAIRPSLYVRNPAKRWGVADEWVTQMLRLTDAQVFKNFRR